ncbi:MAG TPA: hypothetical protein VFV41_01360, partial [Streptosporangiaceae bacterium]|nr:hypothetical protein [Streptosporangiaceae bacterium]
PARSARSARSGAAGSGARRARAIGPGAGPAAGAASQDRPQRPRGHQRAVAAGVVAVLAMFAMGGYLLSRGTGDGGTPAASGQAADATSASPPARTTSPARQPGSTRHAPGSGAPGKLPPTSATPIAAMPPPGTTSAPPRDARPGPRRPHAQVTTQVSVYGPRGHSNVAAVAFSIADAGPAATDHLSAYVALPPGATMVTGGHWGHRGHWGGDRSGWSCSARTGGVSCTHAAIAASGRTGEIIAVQVTGSRACGQPVQVSVTGGALTASAQSAQTIQCRSHHHGWSRQAAASGAAAQQGALRLTAGPHAVRQWPGRDWRGSSGWAGHRRDGQPYQFRWPWIF